MLKSLEALIPCKKCEEQAQEQERKRSLIQKVKRERERVRKLFVRQRVKKENLISVKLFCNLQLKNYRKIVQRSNLNK